MRDTIPRKQQTSHSAWATPALSMYRAGELVESETIHDNPSARRGRMAKRDK